MKTVVGFVDTHSMAEELVEELTKSGYGRDRIEIVRSGAEGARAREQGKGGFLQSIRAFFGGQPESSREVRGYYEEEHRLAVSVIVDEPDVEGVSRIMSLHGAVDIEQRAQGWRSTDTMARHHDPACERKVKEDG